MTDETKGTEIVKSGFGTGEVMRLPEMAASAVAAQASAAVQARYVVAFQRPRSWDEVRVRLLHECSRKSFAEVARYAKPIGGTKIEGLSIRFAEAALRCATNMLIESMAIYDDAEQRIVRVSVTDLETNLTYPKDIVVRKTVERSTLQKDQVPISVRTNSQGRKTYTVPATDDDLLNKENSLISKALRTAALRMIPGDILEECEERIKEVIRKGVETDPDGERKRIVDAFAAMNVLPTRLVEYMGHPLEEASPADLTELRQVYTAIKDGDATFAQLLELKNPGASSSDTEMSQAEKNTAALAEALERKKGGKQKTQEPPPDATPEATPEATGPRWNAKGSCVGCGRHQTYIAEVGHMADCPFTAR